MWLGGRQLQERGHLLARLRLDDGLGQPPDIDSENSSWP